MQAIMNRSNFAVFGSEVGFAPKYARILAVLRFFFFTNSEPTFVF